MSARLSALAALGAIAVLGGALAFEVLGVAATAPGVRTLALLGADPGPADTPGLAVPTAGRAAAAAAHEIVDRPLFFASRRPVPPEPPAVAAAKPEPVPPLDFALVGTILTGSSRVALVKPDKAASVELALGQLVGGWTVSAIDADRIMVRHGATEQLVGLRDFGGNKVLPAAMRPQASQQRQQARR